MANILDYIKWRGDLSIKQDSFNEIDNLILSRFSYLPFDKLIEKDEIVTIKELSERFKRKDINDMRILWDDDIKLFPLMGSSKRFGEMKVAKYVNIISQEEEKQFSAITILMPDNTIYISYRGTDNTIVGWKEDFNMSFKGHVKSQKDAANYLDEVAKEYPNMIRVGGHSKGGNLAVYASAFSNDYIKSRIIAIYNNDGPGFNDEIIETEEYKKMIERVTTYIPQDSIIGRLLTHKERYTVVKSTQGGVMQHDIYSWQVIGKEFEYLKEVTNGSKFIDKSIKNWLEQVDIEKREQVIDIIFEIINSTNKENFGELKVDWFTNATTMLKTYKNVDAESKKMIIQVLKALAKIAKDNFIEELKKEKHSKEREVVIESKHL